MDKKKRLTVSVIVLAVLCCCLAVTSFALAYQVAKLEYNSFQTGGIGIDLNGGKPVITADEYLFEPGMTVEKPFYIKNNGTWAVYYKLYFSQVSGGLGDVLDVTILDEDDNILLTGKLSELTKETVPAMEATLESGQRQDLTIRFHFPKGSGNAVQGEGLTFELSAVGVQTKNSPGKEFE